MSVKELVIDRKIWLRAKREDAKKWKLGDATGSYLLREQDGKRCCLGIYLAACGVPDVLLEAVASPGGLVRIHVIEQSIRDLIPTWLRESEGPLTWEDVGP